MTHFWKHVVLHTQRANETLCFLSYQRVSVPSWGRSLTVIPRKSGDPQHRHPAAINNSKQKSTGKRRGGGRAESTEGKSRGSTKWGQERQNNRWVGIRGRKVWDEEGESNSIMNPGDEMSGGRRRSTCSLLQHAAINSSLTLPSSAAANPTQDGPKPHTCTP